jgi:hypothetical protein
VTFSFTLAEVPNVPTNLPEVDLLLVGNSPNPGGSVDWNETNVIYFQITKDGSSNATYNAQLFFKTNQPAGNSQYWGQRLAAVWSTSKLLGTWSLTFGTNNDVTLGSPDGSTSAGTFPPDALAYFNTTVVPYLGIQPYGIYNPAVVFSHFSATGVATPLDDPFTDFSNWIKAASDNYGMAIHPPGTVAQLSWLGPASGFILEQSSTLTNWSDAVAAGVSTPVQLGDYKKAFVPVSALPSADQGFWRLRKPL